MCRFLIALLTVSALGCQCEIPRVWVEDAQVVELAAADIESLRVATKNGAIQVRARSDDRNIIELTATLRVGAASEEEAYEILDLIEIETPLRDSERTQEIGWRLADDRNRSASIAVSYEILVPARLNVHARTHNGEVDLNAIAGNCDVESRNGAISVLNQLADSAQAPVIRAATYNGRLRVDAVANEVHLSTHNGEIKVRTSAPQLRVESHNGQINGQLLAEGPVDGRIHTHNGAVQLQLSPMVAAQFKCRTDRGSVASYGLDRFEKRNREYIGQVGDGQGRIEIHTHNGSIDLRRDADPQFISGQEVRLQSLAIPTRG